MTNSEQDPGYDTWISNLMTGRQSDADQAASAQFRAMQTSKPTAGRPTSRPAGVEVTGRNTWGVSDRADGLTAYTLLAGPGRWANCTEGR